MANVDISQLVSLFSDFFTSVYKNQIDALANVYPTKKSLDVDYGDLEKFDPELADKFIKFPDEILEAAGDAIKEMNLTLPDSEILFRPHIRIYGLPAEDTLIEQLGSKNINEVVAFKGVVTRRAEVMHKVKMAVYKCQICDEKTPKIPITKNFIEPKRCDFCKKFALKRMDEHCDFVDIQRTEMQELLERIRGGAPAARMELLMEDDLVNTINPGDNIEVVGVLRLRPPLKMKQKQDMIFSRFLEVIHVRSLKRDFEEIEITKEDRKRIIEMSKDPNIETYMTESIAPGIYGNYEVKRALALQLFGGTKGKTMKGGMEIREDIHILLIGDPGIAKSRFLHSVNELAPKSIYVSGKAASGAGMTVSAEKDELGEGGWTLKAGALVLASGGCAQVDEFDKIDEEDTAAMHEAMETQTISVAKAGIVAKFRTKTAILAAANPKWGRFDQTKNLAEQFDIPPTLLSRFDLIFPIVDVLDDERDAKLAQHILTTHMGEDPNPESMPIEKELLRKYIAHARRTVRPKLTHGASDKIKNFYLDIRRKGKDSGSVTITPRYLEGLVRLAEANAKLRLSEVVEERDAGVSIGLMTYVMKQIMTDKETGLMDVDTVATGKPKSTREKLQKADTIMEIIKEILKSHDTADINEVVEQAAAFDIMDQEAKRIISELLRKGDIYEKEHGQIKIT